jgi:hypothetical protein
MDQDDENPKDKGFIFKIALACAPIAVPIFGWGYNLSMEVQDIKIKQIERGPVIAELKADVALLFKSATDPSPKPETKIAVDSLKREILSLDERLGRIEDRLNNMHAYLLSLSSKTPPYLNNNTNQKRHGFFDPPSDLPIIKLN